MSIKLVIAQQDGPDAEPLHSIELGFPTYREAAESVKTLGELMTQFDDIVPLILFLNGVVAEHPEFEAKRVQ